jgi:hypothetical protein
MTLEIKILDRNNHTNVVGLNRIMGSQPSPRECMFVTNEPTILLLEEAIVSPPEQQFFFS